MITLPRVDFSTKDAWGEGGGGGNRPVVKGPLVDSESPQKCSSFFGSQGNVMSTSIIPLISHLIKDYVLVSLILFN